MPTALLLPTGSPQTRGKQPRKMQVMENKKIPTETKENNMSPQIKKDFLRAACEHFFGKQIPAGSCCQRLSLCA